MGPSDCEIRTDKEAPLSLNAAWLAVAGGVLVVAGLAIAHSRTFTRVFRTVMYLGVSAQLLALTLAVIGSLHRNQNWTLRILPKWDVLGVLAGVALGGFLSHLSASKTWKREKAWELLDLLAGTRELLWHPTPFNQLRTHLLRLRSLLRAFGIAPLYFELIEAPATQCWDESLENYETGDEASISLDAIGQFDDAVLATEAAVESQIRTSWLFRKLSER